jgi:hypothetical protein
MTLLMAAEISLACFLAAGSSCSSMVTVNVSLYVLITSPSHMANSGLRIHDIDPDAEEIKKGQQLS